MVRSGTRETDELAQSACAASVARLGGAADVVAGSSRGGWATVEELRGCVVNAPRLVLERSSRRQS
jgi:hypothetical protein